MENTFLFSHYTTLKESILTSLEVLRELLDGRGYQKIEMDLQELILKLREDQFNLVILGHFNRGKSTLINSLLGVNLLPTSIIPLTSIITLIRYGKTLRIMVRFKEGTKKEITPEEIAGYVTELGNPHNEKNVERIEIFYPSPYLREGVVLVDTPGISSIYLDNTMITQNYLPRADAAIFLIGADPPLTQVELDFLKQAKEFIGKIFFLQNKIDQVEESERDQSLEFSKKAIQTHLGLPEVKIYPISAKLALEGKLRGPLEKVEASLLPHFEAALSQFLLQGKGKIFLQSSISQGLRVVEEAEMVFKLEKRAVETPVLDLEYKIGQFNHQSQVIQQEQEDMEILIRGEVKKLLEDLNLDLERFKLEQVPLIKGAIQRCYEAHLKDDKKSLVQALDHCLRQSIEEAFQAWLPLEDEKMRRGFEKIASRFSARANRLVQQIRQISADLFDLPLENREGMETLTSQSRLYYKTEELLGWGLDNVPLLMPKRYFRKFVLGEMLNKVEGELDRNAGRVRYDFLERMEVSLRELKDNLDWRIRMTRENIQNALKRAMEMKVQSEGEGVRRIQELEEKLISIQTLKKKLLNLKKTLEGQEGEIL